MRPVLRVLFPDPIPLKTTSQRRVLEVVADFDVWLELWDGQRIKLATVEKGFISDGVSRPGLVNWWLRRWGPEAKAAILHDWLLWLHEQGLISGPKFLIDLLFLMALVATNISFFRSTVMFLAVRTRP